MNSNMCSCYDRPRNNEFDRLKTEYDSIKGDVSKIEKMEVSNESKKPILEELQKQIDEVKEKMHNYIDTL